MGKHLLVQRRTRFNAGDMLCDGPQGPADILQSWEDPAAQLPSERDQEVTGLQGVRINDKHIA